MPFLPTSTVCSTHFSAGLLHPAADHGVRHVSGFIWNFDPASPTITPKSSSRGKSPNPPENPNDSSALTHAQYPEGCWARVCKFNTAEKLPVQRNDKDPSSKRVGIAGCLRPKSMRAGDRPLLDGRGHGSTDRYPCHRLAHLWQRSCASHSQISYKTIPNSACALRSVPLTVSRIASPQMCSPHFPYLLIVTQKPTLDCFSTEVETPS